MSVTTVTEEHFFGGMMMGGDLFQAGGICGPRRIDTGTLYCISQHRWFLRLIAKLRGGKGMLLRRGRLTRVRLNPLLVVLDILVDGSQGFGPLTSLDEGNDLRA